MQVHIRVETGRKKELVRVLPDGRLRIAVKQKPKDGAANVRVVELVAAHYKVLPSKVRIIRGYTQPSKIVEVEPHST